MDKEQARNKTRARYNRNGPWYDILETPMEWLKFKAWGKRLLARVKAGKILEAGVGTGKNVSYYPNGKAFVALDLSFRMLARARARAERLGMEVALFQMDVENLGFTAGVFDTVFASFLFCSVPDPVEGLKELRRVCKPDGSLVLLERVRPQNRLLGLLFDVLNPLVVRIRGVNINRATSENLIKAGWKIRKEERLSWDNVRLFEAVS
ncbi:MAG: class I SAM-dependent methyltransferase [Deltaproteobacteria bacterium]|nr:class I SAM-dependent methyltransferase [Deltaproteobacteria bacterium]MBW2137422.1 class I SAM-dependent methyltransferase [Deltaproteobacteria bacterium]